MSVLKTVLKWSVGPHKFLSLLLLTVVLIIYLVHLSYNLSVNTETEKTVEIEAEENEVFNTPVAFPYEKLIHIDLKGAPPKISYLLNFISFIKKLGATGILIEYEDTFPYHSGLEDLTAANAYTRSDVIAIVETARLNNLTVIPLIQTFGHLEFVLKHERYKRFREIEGNPQALCPSENDVFLLLYKMIGEILEVHNTSSYLHIGCDEVEVLAACRNCRGVMRKNKWRRDDIYFNHIKKIAEYINRTYPHVRPIVWADKFLKNNEKIIIRHGIPELVDVMFWQYTPKKYHFPSVNNMESYAKMFKTIWIANAFKGATGGSNMVTDVDYHLKNTQGWMEFFESWNSKLQFKGIAITGWQRYNHFMVLCELLPVGIPSMAYILQYLNSQGGLSYYDDVKQMLSCNDIPPMSISEIQDLTLLSRLKCDFPGFKIYHVIHSFYNVIEAIKVVLDKLQKVDFAFYNVVHNTINPTYLQVLNKLSYKQHLLQLEELEKKIKNTLPEVYDDYTVNEWIMSNVMPIQMRLEAATHTINNLNSVKVWPRRPQISDISNVTRIFKSICTNNETRGCIFFNIYKD